MKEGFKGVKEDMVPSELINCSRGILFRDLQSHEVLIQKSGEEKI